MSQHTSNAAEAEPTSGTIEYHIKRAEDWANPDFMSHDPEHRYTNDNLYAIANALTAIAKMMYAERLGYSETM